MKKYLIAVLLLCLPCLAFQSIGRHVEPESCVQAQRILANSGTVVDSFYLNQVMRAIKDNNAYSLLVLAADPNIGVKLSSTNVTTLYDISPTNADGTATGANMPLYTLGYQNGHAAIGYNGTSNFLNVGSSTVYKSLSDMTIFSAFNPTVARVNEFVSNLSSGLKGYGFGCGASNIVSFTIIKNSDSTASNINSSTGVCLLGTLYTFYATKSGVNANLFKNNAQIKSGVFAESTIKTPTANLSLGFYSTSTTYMSGTSLYTLMFSTALTNEQMKGIESVFNAYYKIY